MSEGAPLLDRTTVPASSLAVASVAFISLAIFLAFDSTPPESLPASAGVWLWARVVASACGLY